MDKGIFAQARPLLEEALEGQRTTLGEDHPDTLASLGNLGLLRYNEGKLDAAEPLLRRSVGTLGLPLFFFLFYFFFCNRTSLHSFLVVAARRETACVGRPAPLYAQCPVQSRRAPGSARKACRRGASSSRDAKSPEGNARRAFSTGP